MTRCASVCVCACVRVRAWVCVCACARWRQVGGSPSGQTLVRSSDGATVRADRTGRLSPGEARVPSNRGSHRVRRVSGEHRVGELVKPRPHTQPTVPGALAARL